MENNNSKKHLSFFNRFLKDKGVFDIFYYNVRKYCYNNKTDYSLPSPPKSKLELLTLISHNFIWDDTPQGYIFWNEIENEWMQLIHKIYLWNEKF